MIKAYTSFIKNSSFLLLFRYLICSFTSNVGQKLTTTFKYTSATSFVFRTFLAVLKLSKTLWRFSASVFADILLEPSLVPSADMLALPSRTFLRAVNIFFKAS